MPRGVRHSSSRILNSKSANSRWYLYPAFERLTGERRNSTPGNQEPWQVVSGAEVLQHKVARNIDANVRDVENCENDIELRPGEFQVLLEAVDLRVT